MRPLPEMLSVLAKAQTSADAAESLRRVLRCPIVWSALRDDGVLERCLEMMAGPLTPGRVLLAASGYTHFSGLSTLPSPDQNSSTTADSDSDGSARILLGRVAQVIHEAADASALIPEMLGAPRLWSEALACAWHEIPVRANWIQGLVADGDPRGLRLAANCLLSNHAVSEAAAQLKDALGDQPLRAIGVFAAAGESGLAQALAAHVAPLPESTEAETLIDACAAARLSGDHVAALAFAQSAWTQALAVVADSADALAEAAEADGDSLTSLEARRQAVRATSTPIRRAVLATTLAAQGDIESALGIVPPEAAAAVEKLARGIALALQGDHQQAGEILRSGWAAIESPVPLPGSLARAFVSACEATGEAGLALEMSALQVEAFPSDAVVHLAYAERLIGAGNANAAIDEARLACALDPQADGAGAVLAAALRAAGRAAEALEALKPEAASDAKTFAAAAEYALEAGQPDLALAWSTRLLDVAPDSTRAKTLHAQAVARSGSASQGVDELETLISGNPEDSYAWLALAQLHEQAGDASRAGDTLTQAVQSAPESAELQLALGRWYMRQERWSEAEPHFRQATMATDAPAGGLYDFGLVLETLGRTQESIAVYERSVSRRPGDWNARVALARLLETMGKPADAARWLEGVPLEAPASAHVAAARMTLQRGADSNQARTAIGHLLRARNDGSSGPQIDLLLAQAYETTGEFDRAIESYAQASTSLPDGSSSHRVALLGKGRASLAGGQPATALAAFEQLRRAEPENSQWQVWVARACLANGSDAEALSAARAAVDMDPKSVEALEQWIEAAVRMRENDQAAAAAARLTVLRPEEPAYWLKFAELSIKTGHASEAREAVARAVVSGRKDMGIVRNAASLLIDLDDVAAAERLLESAAKTQPEDPNLWKDLAQARAAAGANQGAAEAWLKVVELAPSEAASAREAAQGLNSLGRTDSALAILKAAHEAQPDNMDLALDLAASYLELGELTAALPLIQSASAPPDQSPEIQVRLGQLLVAAGRAEPAVAILRQAVQASPESPDAWAALAEALLASNKPSESLDGLERAVHLPDAPLTAYALLVHAHLAVGSASSAWDGLRAAASRRPRTLREARAVAGAHLRLAEWQSASNTLDQLLEDTGDSRIHMDAAALALRLQDALWLYGDMAGAGRHAPAMTRDHLNMQAQRHLQAVESPMVGPRGHLIRSQWKAWETESEEGLASLAEACELNGNPPQAVEGLAIAHLRAGNPRDALHALQRVQPSALTGSWLPILAGLCHRELGNTDLARQAFDAAQADPSLAPLAHAFIASLYPPANENAAAVAALNDALAAWPNEPSWQFQLANLYLESEALDSALPHLQQAAELEPDNSDTWLALARTLRETGHLGDAQEAYEHVVQLLPRLSQVWKEAGALALSRTDYRRASDWYAKSLALNASDDEALVGAARADLALGRPREAKKRVEEALALAPASAAALQCLGEILAAEGDVDGALETLQRAIDQSGAPGPLLLARSKLLIRKGRAGDAVKELQAALEADEDDGLWSGLAEGQLALGRFDEAMHAAAEAVRISPRHAAHHLQLARISRQAGHLDRAVEELARAEALFPASADLALERGQLHEDRREFDRALEAYQRAAELEPLQPKAYFRAGLVYRSLKSYAQAARMFRRAVELSPDDASALHQLAAVHALELVHGGFQTSAVTT